jgi:Flp pilus assembly protein TadG
MIRPKVSLNVFSKNEDGGMTIFGLYLAVAMFILGGLAVDLASLISTRTQLQVAADLAAHAALYSREQGNSPSTAKTQAITLVQTSFPVAGFGNLLTEEDIKFGSYNRATQTFSEDNNSREAVYVQTERLVADNNPVSSFLMQFAGFSQWDVITPSVFETYRPFCLRDGWIGDDVVDAQSNNTFVDGFCIHSNTQVEFNSGSYFEDGVIVSAPDGMDDVVVPSSGYDSNVGLYSAITDHYYNLRILNQFPRIRAGAENPNSEFHRTYLDGSYQTLPGKNVVAADFAPGAVHTYECANDKGKLFIDATPVIRDVLIETNCMVVFSTDSALENVMLYVTNTDVRSISAPQGLRLGRDDNCHPENGVNVVTYGGFEVAQEMQIYSSQVLARGPIQFAAAADGVEGGSFISGVTVDGTSNTTMGTCPNDQGEVFEVDLFRLAG